jgi:hypothetical protein
MNNPAFYRPRVIRAAPVAGPFVIKVISALLLAAPFALPPAAHAQNTGGYAQDYRAQPTSPAFAQQELDQMLAPIALYPDALLSQILMAATYPLEVVEAARWSRANPGLDGDRAVDAVGNMNWDPSVKSIVAFPQILAMMDERLSWTEDLGDAFVTQQEDVMDSVQYLRRQAYTAGNLSSDDRVTVDYRDGMFSIAPGDPRFVYVPYYDPLVVFGVWRSPAYPPVRWTAWQGYEVRRGPSGYARAVRINVAPNFFYGAIDWRSRRVNVVNVNNNYYNRTVIVNRPVNIVNAAPQAWQHDISHRGSMPYHRDVAPLNRPAAVENRTRESVATRADARSDNRAEDARWSRTPSTANMQSAVPAGRAAIERQPDNSQGAGRAREGHSMHEDHRGMLVSQNDARVTPAAYAPRPAAAPAKPQTANHPAHGGERSAPQR